MENIKIDKITSKVTEGISYNSNSIEELFSLELKDAQGFPVKLPILSDEWNYNQAVEEFEAILSKELACVQRYEDPRLLVVAGIPGSGKSKIVKDITNNKKKESLVIKFDSIMEQFSLYKNLMIEAEEEGECLYVSQIRREAFLKSEFVARVVGYELLYRAVKKDVNIIFEHSSTPIAHLELYNQIKQLGYKIEMIYKRVEPQVAIHRINSNRGDFRFTPPSYVEERFNIIESLIPEYKKIMNVKIVEDSTRLIIVRHGNTFAPGETPRRVGGKTDLPLVESHRGNSVGKYLKDKGLIPDVVISSPLKRCTQTTEQALKAMGIERDVILEDRFVELNYGPDEGKTEEEVMLRLGGGDIEKGKAVINLWNEKAILPKGWEVDLNQIKQSWTDFTDDVKTKYKGQTIFICSSNGIIRLAPHITGHFDAFAKEYEIKVATGSVSVFELKTEQDNWKCTEWNSKPYKLYPKEL